MASKPWLGLQTDLALSGRNPGSTNLGTYWFLLATRALACVRMVIAFSLRFLQRKRTVWAWVCPSAALLSRVRAVGYGQNPTLPTEPCFPSLCPQPPGVRHEPSSRGFRCG